MKQKDTNNKNYTKPLKKNEEKDPQKHMKGKEELHLMLHKLKKYYNELNKIQKNSTIHLSELNLKHDDLSKQIIDKKAFSNIEFPSEIIAIEDYDKFKHSKETKETITQKIENLMNEKNQLLLKFKNELEYGNTINNLINAEKQNIDDLNEHILKTQDKINTIKSANKNLEINMDENLKKEKIISTVKKDLDSELNKLEDVIGYQNKTYVNMVGDLKLKNNFNQKFKRELDLKNVYLDNQHKQSSERILSEILKIKTIKSSNTEKESYIIKLILGLDIIKKYFIDVDQQGKEINTYNLIKSDDYKTFMSENFLISEHTENNISSNNENKITQSNIEDDKFSVKSKISLKMLKDILDNIDLNHDKIYNFYTKIINKTNFFHNHMINFNFKQISLETKKEQYTSRVKKIIQNNSKSLEDLKMFNPKFEVLMNKFQDDIKYNNLYDNLKEKLHDFNPNPSIHADFYKKCENYLSDIKTFNEFIRFNFKKIKNECVDPQFKNVLSTNYKIMNEKIKIEQNNSDIEKMEYVKDLFKALEMQNLTEIKKLEKISRAIEEYSTSNSQDNNGNKNKININQENNNGFNNMENPDNQETQIIKNNNLLIKTNSINSFNNGNNKENQENSLIMTKNNLNNMELSIKNNSLKSFCEKVDSNQSNNIRKEALGGFPYISPYSGWSIEKLCEEKKISLEKIKILQKKIELSKFFEDHFNLNNIISLEVPLEKILFYFFENTENLINNIKLAKSTIDLCFNNTNQDKVKTVGSTKNLNSNNLIESNFFFK